MQDLVEKDQEKPYDLSRLRGVPIGYTPLPTNVPGEPEGSLWAANFFNNTTIGSFIASPTSKALTGEVDRNLDFIDHIPEDLILDYADRYVGRKIEDFPEITSHIRDEISRDALISAHPWQSFAINLIESPIDPASWLPMGALYKNVKHGKNLARSIIGSGAAGTIGATAQEAIINRNQLTREAEESYANIAASGILAGALGGLGYGFTKATPRAKNLLDSRQRMHKEVVDTLNDTPKKLDENGILDKEDIVNIPAPIRKLMNITPMNRLLNSPFNTAKWFSNVMYQKNYQLQKHLDLQTEGASVESLVRLDMSKSRALNIKHQDFYFDMVGIGKGPLQATRAKLSDVDMSIDEFNLAVWHRMSTQIEHERSAVNAAARMWEEELIKPTRAKAIETGLLSEEQWPVNAPGYILQAYKKDLIIEQGGKHARGGDSFPQFLFEKFKAAQEVTKEYLSSPRVKSLQERITKFTNRLSNEDIPFRINEHSNGLVINLYHEESFARPNRIELKFDNGTAKVVDSQVLPDDQGLGFGKSLYKKAIQYAKDNGLIFASDNAVSHEALKIYKSLEREGYVFEYNPNVKDETITIRRMTTPKNKFGGASYIEESLPGLKSINRKPVVKLISSPKYKESFFKPKEVFPKRINELEKLIKDEAPRQAKNWEGELHTIVDSDTTLWTNVEQTIDNILGDTQGALINPILSKLKAGKSKPLKSRKITIPQEELAPWSVTDIPLLMDMYSRAMHPMIRLTELAKKNGAKDISEFREMLSDMLTKEFDALAKDKTGKAAQDLRKKREQNISDMNDTFDLLMGIYGDGTNVLNNTAQKYYQNFLKWNYIRLLGYMTISSIADAGAQVFVHGPYRFIHDGLVQSFSEAAKINRRDLRAIGYAMETELGTRLHSWVEHQGLSTNPGPFTKGLDVLTRKFGNLSLMNQWNTLMQSIAGHIGINRSLEAIHRFVEGKPVSQKELERLVKNGLAKEHWETIYNFTKNNKTKDGAYFADWQNWDIKTKAQREALEQFQSSITQEIDSIVIVPGLGDKPLFAHKPVGKLLFQFKSFSMAATNRLLYSGIQRRDDINMYLGVLSMLSMGALSYVASSLIKGKEPDLSFDNLSREAVDRSGLVGIWGEASNVLSKQLGFSGTSRYQTRDWVGALSGPSAGAISELFSIARKGKGALASDADFTTNDAYKIQRLQPLQNLFYLERVNKYLYRNTALELGARDMEG